MELPQAARPAEPAPAQASADAAGPEHALRGIGFMVLAMCLVPFMDGIAKHLSASYAVGQIVWARYFFHLALLLPLVLWRHGLRSLNPPRPGLQILRGGLMLGATILFFASIALIPLADATALVFISPLVVTALSPWLLSERVGARRWAAVAVGFLGACIIIRPGSGLLDWGGLLAVAAGVVYACFLILTRKLAGSAPAAVTLAHTALVGALVMSLALPLYWTAPGPADLGLMAAMGLIAAVAHFFLIRAYDHAPASLLAPYSYSEIVMATAIGFAVFGDFPDAWTWCGIAVIVASGIYVSLRARRARGIEP